MKDIELLISEKLKKRHGNTIRTEKVSITNYVLENTFSLTLKNYKRECGTDEYSFTGRSILNSCLDSFLDYMFRTEPVVTRTVGGFPVVNPAANMKWKPVTDIGKGTLIWCSNTNEERDKIVEKSNRWARRNSLPLMFHSLDSLQGCSGDTVEKEAKSKFRIYPDYHHVFYCGNMADRSFSVVELVNGVMLINAPLYASQMQKVSRLRTQYYELTDPADLHTVRKTARVYWFNFHRISATISCPLWEFCYEDKRRCRELSEDATTYTQVTDIFHVDEKGNCSPRMVEADISRHINARITSHDRIQCILVNSDEIQGFCEILREKYFTPEFIERHRKDLRRLTSFARTDQVDIDAGRTIRTKTGKPARPAEDDVVKERNHRLTISELIAKILEEAIALYDNRKYDIPMGICLEGAFLESPLFGVGGYAKLKQLGLIDRLLKLDFMQR